MFVNHTHCYKEIPVMSNLYNIKVNLFQLLFYDRLTLLLNLRSTSHMFVSSFGHLYGMKYFEMFF